MEQFIPPNVSMGIVAHRMGFAVNLDGEPPLQAGEIQYEAQMRKLPPEAKSARPATQLLPEEHFGQCHFATKVACKFYVASSGADCSMTNSRGIGPSTMLRMVPLPVPGRI
jgi:hypothetical protein